jgi:DNA-binding transcriptional ArsR family regulator
MKNPNRKFKDSIYEQFARIGKAVSSPKRLELLNLLCQGEKSVESTLKTVFRIASRAGNRRLLPRAILRACG